MITTVKKHGNKASKVNNDNDDDEEYDNDLEVLSATKKSSNSNVTAKTSVTAVASKPSESVHAIPYIYILIYLKLLAKKYEKMQIKES